MLNRQIEQAALNAWPALQQIMFDGWILRFSQGYTKRANSVNPFFASTMDVRAKIEVCEQLYAEKGLPTIFRITPFSSPPHLDRVLASRNYDRMDLTLVLDLNLRGCEFSAASSEQLREEPLDAWMATFCNLSAPTPDKQQAHKAILQAIPSRRLLASLGASGQVVSCGMGVLDRGFFGLYDLVTGPQHRNKGHGTKLVSAMLHWAQENGATRAYLQVVSSNTPARHLYTQLGFRETYQYWYRVPPLAAKELLR